MGKTAIQWTDETWNPVTGCKAVSEGCQNCYAAHLAATRLVDSPRYKGLAHVNSSGRGVWSGNSLTHQDKLLEPYRKTIGRMIFVADMSDLFFEEVPTDFIDKVFAVMAHSPQHTFQLLTKRPLRMLEYLSSPQEVTTRWFAAGRSLGLSESHLPPGRMWPLPNVWCGTSIESTKTMRERLLPISQVPAAVRFLSMEPLLEDVLLDPPLFNKIDWVIVGGESCQANQCRGCDVWWIRSLLLQCKAAKVPAFIKQLGSLPFRSLSNCLPTRHEGLGLRDRNGGDMSEWPSDLRVREWPTPRGAV